MAQSETILSAQTHPGDSTTETVTGEKFKGDGYYGRSDGFHTVQYTLEGFVGTIDIQATLAVDPADADWFTIYTQAYPVANDEGTTGSFMTNFTGNYVWVRAYVNNWTDGTINSIQLNH
jgi:hypothetical protein